MLTRMDHKAIRPALEAINVKKAVAIDCLSEAECTQYVEWADSLGYRQARAVTGSETAPVQQDFELNYEIPQDHFFGIWRSLSKKASDRWWAPIGKRQGFLTSR